MILLGLSSLSCYPLDNCIGRKLAQLPKMALMRSIRSWTIEFHGDIASPSAKHLRMIWRLLFSGLLLIFSVEIRIQCGSSINRHFGPVVQAWNINIFYVWTRHFNPVITVQIGACKFPLWLVHPGVGEKLVYMTLVKYNIENACSLSPSARLSSRVMHFLKVFLSPFRSTVRVSSEYSLKVLTVSRAPPTVQWSPSSVLESHGDKVPFLGVSNLPSHIMFRMRQLDWTADILNLCYFWKLIGQDYVQEISLDIHQIAHDVLDLVISKAPSARMADMTFIKQKLTNWADLVHRVQAIAQDHDTSGMAFTMDAFYTVPLPAVAKSKHQRCEEYLNECNDFIVTWLWSHEIDVIH